MLLRKNGKSKDRSLYDAPKDEPDDPNLAVHKLNKRGQEAKKAKIDAKKDEEENAEDEKDDDDADAAPKTAPAPAKNDDDDADN